MIGPSGFGAKTVVFFDATPVIRAMDDATRRVLSKFGSFVRTRARTSMKKRKTPSAPGRPPRVVTGHLRRLIFFGYDFAKASVVIGPTPFRGPAIAPRLLEEGGTTVAKRDRFWRAGVGSNAKGQFTRGKWGRVAKGEPIRVAPRPYMGPAFHKEIPSLPALWRDSIRGV